MPVGLGDGMDNKAKKVHPCAWHSQASTNEGTRFVAEHTNEYEYAKHAGLSFDLTRGLGECPILSYLAIQEVE